LGRTILADGFGALAGLAEQLQVWEEEVAQKPPGALKLVEQRAQLGLLQALITQQLAHVSSVFLFHMRLVVFPVRPAAGQRNRAGPIQQVTPEVAGEELRAVVHVKAQQFKGQVGFQLFDLLEHAVGAFVPNGAVLGPLAENVCKGQAPDEVPRRRVAAVGDGVGLQETGPVHVVIVRADGI